MLKFLTHKLRTHSLNEESVSEKVEERDSGTESDDEADRPDAGDFCADVIMKWNDITDLTGARACLCSGPGPGPGPGPLPHAHAHRRPAASPAPPHAPPPPHAHAHEPDLLYDHHSSEEELEVINGAREGEGGAGAEGGAATAALAARLDSRRRAASSPAPAGAGKRKWPRSPRAPHTAPRSLSPRAPGPAGAHAAHPDDDDDERQVETPVRFRTSPPLEALKPRRAPPLPAGSGAEGGRGAGSPGWRRRRVALPPRRHRPALDFDKMQQLRVVGAGGAGAGPGGVRSWRGVGGAHNAGGELSVFCW